MHRSFGLEAAGLLPLTAPGTYSRLARIGYGPKERIRRARGSAACGLGREVEDNGEVSKRRKSMAVSRQALAHAAGSKLFASRDGSVHVLYRSATKAVHRDIYLITSSDHGKSFRGGLLHKWE